MGLERPSFDEMCIGIIGQVARVPLAVDEATHEGLLDLATHSEAFAFTTDCSGPSSLRVDTEGSVSGVAACGLDISGSLYTVEVTISGTMDAKGGAAGEVVVTVRGLADTASDTWTATAAADGSLSIPLQLEGIFSGGDVSFDGVYEATPLP